ncbi:hypothetical protein PGQ11_009545 [Apiospora arundinis]|uniref:Uncharacterized protein n=1 Tax=Apiospora arundinis TaxID=335852 RepID=A0ABR2IIU3_9PEZI
MSIYYLLTTIRAVLRTKNATLQAQGSADILQDWFQRSPSIRSLAVTGVSDWSDWSDWRVTGAQALSPGSFLNDIISEGGEQRHCMADAGLSRPGQVTSKRLAKEEQRGMNGPDGEMDGDGFVDLASLASLAPPLPGPLTLGGQAG